MILSKTLMTILLQILAIKQPILVEITKDKNGFDWQQLLFSIITGTLALLGIFLAAWLAYKYAIKQLSKSSAIEVEKNNNNAKIKAYEKGWALLRYITEVENNDSIIIWEQEKGNDQKHYFLIAENAKKFMEELPTVFYKEGAGLHYEREIKEDLFKLRNIVYGLLLISNKPTGDTFEILNQELIHGIKVIFERLRDAFSQSLNSLYNFNSLK